MAECFEAAGGVPAEVLADRMGCLKGGVVANVVVPTAGYVRFATHYGFRPDFCEAKDPESKGAVEALVRYAKSDLVVPADDFGGDLSVGNTAAAGWCAEVNAAVHSEIQAVPNQRLAVERDVLRALPSLRASMRRGVTRKVDKLAAVRIGSARYSVPHLLRSRHVEVATVEDRIEIWHDDVLVAAHRLVPPGGTSILDEHYDRPARKPSRAGPGISEPDAAATFAVPAPVWIVEQQVPAEPRLPHHHVHVDHLYLALAAQPQIPATAEIRFAWFGPDDLDRLGMFQDSRSGARLLFSRITELGGNLVKPAAG
jgi:hypothetical protein